jgi:COMPASS component SWD1
MEIYSLGRRINMSYFMLQEFDGALDCISLAVTCSFNKRGTLLAVGCNDGRIVIWDFLTRGIAKIISAHVHPVCSLRLVWV